MHVMHLKISRICNDDIHIVGLMETGAEKRHNEKKNKKNRLFLAGDTFNV